MSAEQRPRISVVIPNYNRADLLEDTLRSIDEDEPINVIVVDDCSPDPLVRAALRGMRDAGLIDDLILLETNGGMARAHNVGIASARTEYIQLISNDDLFEPGAIGKLAELLDRNPRAAAAVGAFQSFGDGVRYYQPPPFDPWLLLFESAWPACHMLRRSAWEDIGGMREDSLFEDWNAFLNYASHGHEVEVLDGLVYHYRVTSGASLWKTVRAQYREQYSLLRRHYPAFFARERELRAKSPASTRQKLLAKPLRMFRLYRPVFLTEFVVGLSRTKLGARILGSPTRATTDTEAH